MIIKAKSRNIAYNYVIYHCVIMAWMYVIPDDVGKPWLSTTTRFYSVFWHSGLIIYINTYIMYSVRMYFGKTTTMLPVIWESASFRKLGMSGNKMQAYLRIYLMCLDSFTTFTQRTQSVFLTAFFCLHRALQAFEPRFQMTPTYINILSTVQSRTATLHNIP